MINSKKITKYILVFLSLLLMPISAYATEAKEKVDIITMEESQKEKNYEVSIKKPYVKGSAYKVNQQINLIIENKLNEAKELQPLEVNIDYKHIVDGDIVSVLIYTDMTGASTSEEVNSIVYDNSQTPKKVLNMTDQEFMGKNGIKIANKIVQDTINNNPEKYIDDYKNLKNEKTFYLKDGDLYLVFDKYEIAAGSLGVQEIKVDLSKIHNYPLSPESYKIGTGYKVRMIPIREIGEIFGYTVSFFPVTKTMKNPIINIARDKDLISFSLNENKFVKNNLEKSLEVPAELIDGTTYVPISFMSEILDLFYDVDSSGNIVFSEYR